MSNTSNDVGMRPKLGQSYIFLPVTFDYSGGRGEQLNSKILWSVIIGIVGSLIGIGVIFNKGGFIVTNILLGIGVIYLTFFIIRFALFREASVRKNHILSVDSDYKREYKEIWGIYDIDSKYPYYCRFKNGRSGVFVRLNKDVILGKYSEAQYEHYEAIGDAYNLAGSGNVRICHIDYMDNVGTDERIDYSFSELSDVKNEDLRDLLTDIYTYQQEQMKERVTTFDVYLFSWSGSDVSAWNTIQGILSCFLEANYRSYHVLNSADIRDLFQVLYNLHDFSVVDAISDVFYVEDISGVYPIEFTHNGETTKVGKTFAEKEQERKELERKKSSGKKSDEEEFDLF